MSGYKETIANFELRIGILEDRHACMGSDYRYNVLERTLIENRIEAVKKLLKDERYRFYEVQRLMGPQ